jgi:peptide/nickel transport system substrate-binding protein
MMTPWVIEKAYLGASKNVTLTRNPYYFRVDTAGNQLPYLDRVEFVVSESVEDLTLRALKGEIDLQDRHIATLANKSVFFKGQEKGGYHLFETVPSASNAEVLALNLNHEDPVKRKLYNNKDFRVALSLAINRDEIIDALFVGQSKPFQVGPRPESEFYDEQLATQFTKFDPEEAKKLLDKVGLKVGSSGMRQMEDGRPVSIQMDVIAAVRPEWIDGLQMAQSYWRAVGIDLQINTVDRTIFYESRRANKHDAQVWAGDGGIEVMLDPRWYFPYSDESIFAIKWQAWFNNPSQPLAEEPPAVVKKQMDLYRQAISSGDPAEQAKLMKEVIGIARDQFYVIGLALAPSSYGIVRNDFKNTPKSMPSAYVYPNPAPTVTPAYFKAK